MTKTQVMQHLFRIIDVRTGHDTYPILSLTLGWDHT